MKKNNIPANNAVPANAENKKLVKRQRRLRHLAKLGLSEEEILKIFENESVRMILCLYYTSFTKKGTRIKKTYKRDKNHHVVDVTEKEVEITLTGHNAAEAFLKENNIEAVKIGPTYCYIKTDVDHVNDLAEKLKEMGRVSITAPEPVTKESLEKEKEKKRKLENKKNRKPSNNTAEAKAAAKAKRKESNIEKTNMRPYYAALRKGGVCKRIKMHNKPLAEKIEKWLEDMKKSKASKVKGSEEERAKHRQLTSLEMKHHKKARKEAKKAATKERRIEREKKRAEINAKAREKRAQKAAKPVQTEIKMAA